MAPPNDQAVGLARKLRDLRLSTWPDHELTQAQLAKALSSEGRVAGATLSSWESTTSPKKVPPARLSAYARFFCTQRSLEGEPHLIPEDELEPAELKQFQKLEAELLELLNPIRGAAQHSFRFDAGPIAVICPDAPAEARGPLADEQNPNFTKLQKYGDLDALIELYGHIRAENPTLDVFHKLASEVESDDLSTHVILAWRHRLERGYAEHSRTLLVRARLSRLTSMTSKGETSSASEPLTSLSPFIRSTRPMRRH